MQAVVTTYVVVASLPVVVEEGSEAISYAPGSVFQALSSNPSVIRLMDTDQVIEVTGVYPMPGSTVIQGPTGPAGDPALVGWERIAVGQLVRLIEPGDQVSVGQKVQIIARKITQVAAKKGFGQDFLLQHHQAVFGRGEFLAVHQRRPNHRKRFDHPAQQPEQHILHHGLFVSPVDMQQPHLSFGRFNMRQAKTCGFDQVGEIG